MKKSIIIIIASILISAISCKRLEVEPPVSKISAETVFKDKLSAVTALNGIYYLMSSSEDFIGGSNAISGLMALSADEVRLVNTDFTLSSFYSNNVNGISSVFWGTAYKYLFSINAIIEGVEKSESINQTGKESLLGEAKFLRAFIYFYLVNLYGDVPLVTTTDYQVNNYISRSPETQVYQQIIQDLLYAEHVIKESYVAIDLESKTNERIRPNKYAVKALLSRVYLYNKDFEKAEAKATEVISNELYNLTPLNDVFLKNSSEAIWQIQPTGEIGRNTKEPNFFMPGFGFGEPNVYLSPDLMQSFEEGDGRSLEWIRATSKDFDGNEIAVKPFVYKYKQFEEGVTTEYTMIIRLAEVYLIRAESRIMNNKVPLGIEDLNILRSRARTNPTTSLPNPLPPVSSGIPFHEAKVAVLKERQTELFCEWGNRWFDLKRTGEIDEIMEIAAGKKNGIWAPYKKLLPIPYSEFSLNPNLRGHQNPGYQEQ